jgi:hypothetical protein
MNRLQINRLSEESKTLGFLYFSFGSITILIGLHYLFLQNPAWFDTTTGILLATIGTVITAVGLVFNRNNIIEIDNEKVVIDMLFLGRLRLNWSNVEAVEIKRKALTFITKDGKTQNIKLIWLGGRLCNNVKLAVAKFARTNNVTVHQKNQPQLINA